MKSLRDAGSAAPRPAAASRMRRPSVHAARAFLDASLDDASTKLRDAARAFDLPVREGRHGVVVTLPTGTLRMSGAEPRTAVDIEAERASDLQFLRDLVAEWVAEIGMRLHWQAGAAGRRPDNLSLARVDGIERISPSYARVALTGPDLARLARGGLHFRLLFGPEGAGWPVTDEGGVTHWPGGVDAWHRPVYTTRTIEALSGGAARITFDVFLHAGGRVAEWTTRAQVGDEVGLTGPGGGERPFARWLGLVGDETAVPVIARILAETPPDAAGEAVLFVPQATDIQDLARPDGLSVRWVVRGAATETPLEALHALRPPESGRFVFFAAERREAFAARDWLQAQAFGRGASLCASYWTAEP